MEHISNDKIKLTSSELVLLNAEHFSSIAKPKGHYKVVLFGVILLLLSGFMTYYAFDKLIEAWSTKNWDSTYGLVLVSEIDEDYSSEGTEIYSVIIDYSYTVNNIVYHGNEVNYGSKGVYDSNLESKKRIIETYNKGKEVMVYYNPKDHSQAILETGIHFNNILILIIGLVFLFVSIALLIKNVPLIITKN